MLNNKQKPTTVNKTCKLVRKQHENRDSAGKYNVQKKTSNKIKDIHMFNM